MKFVQIKSDGTMYEQDKPCTSRNIRKIMRDIAKVKKLHLLYEWSNNESLESESTIQCYGCITGNAGHENKHDLPVDGTKRNDALDPSDTQLLFNDIFIIKLEQKHYVDFDVSDYSMFYTACFEGFDECHSDDETSEGDDSSLDGFIVGDGDDSDDSFAEDDVVEDGVEDDVMEGAVVEDDGIEDENVELSDDEESYEYDSDEELCEDTNDYE